MKTMLTLVFMIITSCAAPLTFYQKAEKTCFNRKSKIRRFNGYMKEYECEDNYSYHEN